jgi:hypothetical protein
MISAAEADLVVRGDLGGGESLALSTGRSMSEWTIGGNGSPGLIACVVP